ncbi:transposase [Xenorhabdus bovienii]|uniref:IS110 family transposase n=1 Tax=Xenorhabdus bovienii TaxID=40576 RepID=UPI001EDDA972|nr:transposase [Xenorhabdus bovienii]MCG3472225.1 transposase [Xenorhabdus bovienii]
MSDNIVVGIDMAKRKFDVAVWLGKHHYKTKLFSNCHFCMEATGVYGHPLAIYLSDKCFTLSVVNPLQIHAFGKCELLRNKTDKIDIKLIARYYAS